jgi:superfamily II DNA or RNA helicase
MNSFKLRPYQDECVTATLRDLESYEAVANVLPTGAGKTECFIRICERWLAAHPGQAVLELSHLSLLTEQTLERFAMRAPNISVGVLQANRAPKWDAQVVISTMQTSRLRKRIEQLKARVVKNVGLILVDEAHMITTPSYETIRSYFPDAKLIGFTATPFRGSKIMTSCFDKVSFSISLQELIDAGYLVPPKVFAVPAATGDLATDMANVMGLYKAHEEGRGAIVYMQSIEDAKSIALAFQEIGVPSRAITQDLVGPFRQTLLNDFNKGALRVLSTVNVLTAGFDSPAVGAIFMPYGTHTPATYVQRIGRGLRPDAPSGKIACHVYIAGNAPSVSQSVYERLTSRLLGAGGPPRNCDTFREDIEHNDYEPNTEIYRWTQAICNAVTKMEKLGMTHFASLLDSKAFPPRFMQSMTAMLAALPDRPSSVAATHTSISENQKAYLFQAGFGSVALTGVTKSEASMMISTVVNMTGRPSSSTQRFIVPEGTHRGKHVSELPHAYRSLVKKRYPDSPVAKLIITWEQERKTA